MTFVSIDIAGAGFEQATLQQMQTIGLSGRSSGTLVKACDITILIPSTNTARIQERASATQKVYRRTIP